MAVEVLITLVLSLASILGFDALRSRLWPDEASEQEDRDWQEIEAALEESRRELKELVRLAQAMADEQTNA